MHSGCAVHDFTVHVVPDLLRDLNEFDYPLCLRRSEGNIINHGYVPSFASFDGSFRRCLIQISQISFCHLNCVDLGGLCEGDPYTGSYSR